MTDLPPWVLLHVPHDSTRIPEAVRHQFALSDSDLERELLLMTDHHTFDLFGGGVPDAQVIRAPVSRLVLDVERFEEDVREPMALRGMGVVYMKTHDGQLLRHALRDGQREKLLNDWYRPHHAALTLAAEKTLEDFGRVVIIDCHSFPSKPLPYEIDQTPTRPQICIGTDAFHTPAVLASSFVDAFKAQGWTVGLNAPFSGALVPLRYYGLDRRAASLMIEVRRDGYLDETTGRPNESFSMASKRIRTAILHSLAVWHQKFDRDCVAEALRVAVPAREPGIDPDPE
jgi:N-formylglutamate deformylase